MLSLLSKAVGYLTGDTEEDEEPPPRAPRQPPWLLNDSAEKTKEQTRTLTGKVTAIHSNYGLVDGDIYFSFDTLMGAAIPKVGASVEVKAKRQSEASGWCAVSVKVLVVQTGWDEASSSPASTAAAVAADDDGWLPSQPHHLDVETTGPHSLVAMVTEMREDHGYLNGTVFFESTACEGPYMARRGDWVSAEVEPNSSGAQEAKTVQPLRKREFEGHVTKVAQHLSVGFIDDEIVFNLSLWTEMTPVRRGDAVQGLAVECSGRTIWRAYSIEPAKSKEPTIPGLQDRIAHSMSPSRPQYADLFTDREGIQITGSLDLGDIQLQRCKVVGLQIRNVGPEEQTFQGCAFPSSHQSATVFKLTRMSYGSIRPYVQTELPLDEAVVLPPNANRFLIMSVSCQPGDLGRMRQMILFEFSGFKIARWATFNGLDPKQWELTDGAAYRGKRNQVNRPQRSGETWVVPGQRPQRSTMAIQLPNRLPQYPIPESLRVCVEQGEDLFKVAPTLAEELNLGNYRSRFQALLHLEELQQEDEMRQFDMDGVSLRPVREFLALEVPGLSEGRPSLLVGDRVILSKNSNLEAGPDYEGFVHEVHRDEVLLKFQDEFQQKYTGDPYNVSFQFNRTSFRRMHQAVEFAPKLGATVLFPTCLIPKAPQLSHKQPSEPVLIQAKATGMRRCPLNAKSKVKTVSPRSSCEPLKFVNPLLNARQRSAVQRILSGQSRPTPYILFGPPGTGKTVTVVETILQTFTQLPSSRMVVCAPSNSAADLLAERLHASGLIKPVDMVRLNAFHRALENIPSSIHAYCDDGDNLELVARHRILVCTCSTAGMMYALGLKAGHFTHAFIDEAGQATEAECMIAAGLVAGEDGQVVLAGDPMQLGAVLRSHDAKHFGLNQSLQERLINRDIYKRNELRFADHGCYDPFLVTKLVQNYRSHPVLLKLPSDLFYHGELEPSAPADLVDVFCKWQALPNQKDCPLIFHGLRGEDLREGSSPSWFNAVEALQVMKYLQLLTNNDIHQLNFDDIGIITPYRKQVEKIRLLIDKLGMEKVKVGSVEEFQGQEKPAIIISMVRSQESEVGADVRHNLGFLSNPKRFNVAITRAQSLLIIIGNPHVLINDEFWREYITYCVRHGAYTGCDLPEGLAQLVPEVQDQGHDVIGEGHAVTGDDEMLVENQEVDIMPSKIDGLESHKDVSQTQDDEDLTPTNELSKMVLDNTVPRVNDTEYSSSVNICTVQDGAVSKNNIEPDQNSVTLTNEVTGYISSVDKVLDIRIDACEVSEDVSSSSEDTSSVDQVSVIDVYDNGSVNDLSPLSGESRPVTETLCVGSAVDPITNEVNFEVSNDVSFTEKMESEHSEPLQVENTNSEHLQSDIASVENVKNDDTEAAGTDNETKETSSVCDVAPCDDKSNVEDNDGGSAVCDGNMSGASSHSVISAEQTAVTDESIPHHPSAAAGDSNSIQVPMSGSSEPDASGSAKPDAGTCIESSADLIPSSSLDDSKEEESSTDANITKLAVVQPSPKVDDVSDQFVNTQEIEMKQASVDESERCESKANISVPLMELRSHIVPTSMNSQQHPHHQMSQNILPACASTEDMKYRGTESNLSVNQKNTMSPQELSSPGTGNMGQLSNLKNVVSPQEGYSSGAGNMSRLVAMPVEKTEKSPPRAGGYAKPSLTDMAIIRQLQYYFNDFNLSRDAFMIDQMKKFDGWVPLDVLITFKRLKLLAGTTTYVIDVLKNVPSKYVQLNEDCTMVGRIHPLPDYNDEWMTTLRNRAVHMDRVPLQPGIEALEEFFSAYGTVEHIQILPGYNRVRRDRGDIIVVFGEAASARKLLLQRNVFFKGSRMRPSVRNDVQRLLYPNKRHGFIHGQPGTNPPSAPNNTRPQHSQDLNRRQEPEVPSGALPGTQPYAQQRGEDRTAINPSGSWSDGRERWDGAARTMSDWTSNDWPQNDGGHPGAKPQRQYERRARPGIQNTNHETRLQIPDENRSFGDNSQAQTAPISPNYEVHAGGMRSPRGQADRTDNPAEPYHIQSWGTDGNHLASWGIEAPAPQTNKGMDNKSQQDESMGAKPQRQYRRQGRPPRFQKAASDRISEYSAPPPPVASRLEAEDPSATPPVSAGDRTPETQEEDRWHNKSNIPPRFRRKQNMPEELYEGAKGDRFWEKRNRSDSTTSRSSNSGDEKPSTPPRNTTRPPGAAHTPPRIQAGRGKSYLKSQSEREPRLSSAMAAFMNIRSTFTPSVPSSDVNKEDDDDNHLNSSFSKEECQDKPAYGSPVTRNQSPYNQDSARRNSGDTNTGNTLYPGWSDSPDTSRQYVENTSSKSNEPFKSDTSVSGIQDATENYGVIREHSDNENQQGSRSEPRSRSDEESRTLQPRPDVAQTVVAPQELSYEDEEDEDDYDWQQYSNLEQADDDVIIESSDEEIIED